MAFGNRLINTSAGASGPTGATYIALQASPYDYVRGVAANGTDVMFLDDTNNRVTFSSINSWTTFYETQSIVAGISDFRAITFQPQTNYFWSAPSGGGLTRIYRWTRGSQFSNAQIIPPFNTNDLSFSDEGILASSGNTVAVYDSSNALIRTFTVSQHSGNLSVAWDGENMWCGGNSDNFIYKYDKLGTYLGVSINMNRQFDYLAYDGIYWYVMTAGGIYKYIALF